MTSAAAIDHPNERLLAGKLAANGFELCVGKPQVIYREIDGVKCEPYELLTVDVEHSNTPRDPVRRPPRHLSIEDAAMS